MLQLTDCIAFSGLNGDQLEAVAVHKRLPMIIAAEWAGHAFGCAGGCRTIGGILAEEARAALADGNHDRFERYRRALDDFVRDHPGLVH